MLSKRYRKGFLAYTKTIFVLTSLMVIFAATAIVFAQNGDTTPPVTTKIYGEPNEPGVFEISSCDGPVNVSVHFINTSTTITLIPTDEGSGVNSTNYTILVPVQCEGGTETEWVGNDTNRVYQSEDACFSENVQCNSTWWNVKEGFGDVSYEGPFNISQESVHKICYLSVDNAGNIEDKTCQVTVVDNGPPTIYSAEVDHHIVDLEYYSGGGGSLTFSDPKCTWVTINATDTHGIDDVQIGVGEVLQEMFQNIGDISGFNQANYENYLADDMHNMPSLSNELVEQGEDDLYRYWFCPAVHIAHLLDFEVLPDSWPYSEFNQLLSEKLALGEFELPIWVNDTVGREVHTSVNVTIVDLTVPLEEGWNLRSTPVALEGDRYWPSGSIDTVLRWESSTQSWELVTDNSIEPLDALYIHATDTNQIGYIFERDQTAPPVRQLDAQWNLVGMALELNDYWYWPDEYYCSPWSYSSQDCYLTSLDSEYSYIGEAFGPLVYDANGNRALEAVLSPQQYLYYYNDWGYWYFNQYSFVWIPQISSQGADPDNYYDQNMINFGGYWVFMQNPDLLPGFTTTPLPVNYD